MGIRRYGRYQFCSGRNNKRICGCLWNCFFNYFFHFFCIRFGLRCNRSIFCCLFRILCLIAGCQHRQQQDKQPKCVPFSHGILLMFLIFSRNLSVPDFVPVFFSSALFLFLCFFEIPTIHFENLLYK